MLAYLARQLRNPALWRLALVVYWLTAFVLTHLPQLGPLGPATQHDELMHASGFAALALILATTWQLNAGELTVAQLGWAWLALALYAALDEWTQPFVGRDASLTDWAADAAGTAVGLVLFAVIRKWIRRRFV